MFSVEWQKRGLPHAHILIWLRKKIRPNTIDKCISAEFPNADEDPELYNIVRKQMVHGPCGTLNRNSPWLKYGKDREVKEFPKKLMRETHSGEDGYPKYRRRSPDDGGFTATIRQGNPRSLLTTNGWSATFLCFTNPLMHISTWNIATQSSPSNMCASTSTKELTRLYSHSSPVT